MGPVLGECVHQGREVLSFAFKRWMSLPESGEVPGEGGGAQGEVFVVGDPGPGALKKYLSLPHTGPGRAREGTGKGPGRHREGPGQAPGSAREGTGAPGRAREGTGKGPGRHREGPGKGPGRTGGRWLG